jgi:hypothetical protein
VHIPKGQTYCPAFCIWRRLIRFSDGRWPQERLFEKTEWRLRYLHSKPQETLRRDCIKHNFHAKGCPAHADYYLLGSRPGMPTQGMYQPLNRRKSGKLLGLTKKIQRVRRRGLGIATYAAALLCQRRNRWQRPTEESCLQSSKPTAMRRFRLPAHASGCPGLAGRSRRLPRIPRRTRPACGTG